jgi:hypothetical protein
MQTEPVAHCNINFVLRVLGIVIQMVKANIPRSSRPKFGGNADEGPTQLTL